MDMEIIFALLTMIFGLGGLVCFIMVLIKLFRNEGVGHGIAGLICGLYAFIWGWRTAGKNQNRNVMMAWTAFIIFGILFNIGMAHAVAQRARDDRQQLMQLMQLRQRERDAK